MLPTPSIRWIYAASWLPLTLLVTSVAAQPSVPPRVDDTPPSKEACIEAHAATQRLRRQGRFVEARQRALRCSNSACPAPLQTECEPWVGELASSISSLRLITPQPDVRIAVDGVFLRERVSPEKPIVVEVDPGTHRLLAVSRDERAFELSVTVANGERNLEVKLEPPQGASTPAGSVAAPSSASAVPSELAVPSTTSAPTKRPTPRSTPTSAWVMGGVGTAGLVVFGAFALQGRAKQAQLEKNCAPFCSRDEVTTMRREYLVADLGLLVAAGGFGTALWLTLRNPDTTTTTSEPRAGAIRVGLGAVGPTVALTLE